MVAIIGGVDNGSFFVPFRVLTFWRPFARFPFYRKQYSALCKSEIWAIENLSNASGKSLDVTVNLVVSTDRFPQITQLTIIEIRSITSIIVVRFFIFLTTLCLAIINPAPQIPIYCFVYFIIFICLHQCLVQSMELKPIDSNVKREPGPVPLPFFFPWCIMPGNLMREEGML